MIDKIKCENRIGCDIHKELIAMWNELQKGWNPPSHITEEEAKDIMNTVIEDGKDVLDQAKEITNKKKEQ